MLGPQQRHVPPHVLLYRRPRYHPRSCMRCTRRWPSRRRSMMPAWQPRPPLLRGLCGLGGTTLGRVAASLAFTSCWPAGMRRRGRR